MSTASINRSVETVSQAIADLLTNPALFNTTVATNLLTSLELIKGQVRELPLRLDQKTDILNRITQAENIINSAVVARMITVTQVNSILGVLQLVLLKVATFSCPC